MKRLLIALPLLIACRPGDMNRDGRIDLEDVPGFVRAVTGEAFDPLADINGDGAVTTSDINGFVNLVDGD